MKYTVLFIENRDQKSLKLKIYVIYILRYCYTSRNIRGNALKAAILFIAFFVYSS